MNKVKEFVAEYNLSVNSYYQENEDPHAKRAKEVEDIIDEWPEKGYPPAEVFIPIEYKSLLYKWESFVERGYNGILMHPPCPKIWYEITDKFLDYVKEECPNFRIGQISVINGSLQFYLIHVNKEISKEAKELSKVLSDNKLKEGMRWSL